MILDTFYRNTKLSILTIILCSFISYTASLPNKFIWDDEEQIVTNPQVHTLSNIPSLFVSGIVNNQSGTLTGGYYRPILTTTHTVLFVSGGGNPLIFRLFQVLLHTANAVLIFYLLKELLHKAFNHSDNHKLVLWGSIIFAVHPGISEAILFNSALAEPLFTVFTLAAILSIIKYQTTPHIKYLVLTGITILLGLLTKETAIIFFPLTASLFYSIYKIKNITKPQIITLLAPVTLYFLLRIQALGKIFSASLNFPSLIGKASLTQKLLTIPYELAFYISLSVQPYKLAIQQHPVVKEVNDISFWGNTLLIICIIILALTYIKPKKPTLFFLTWFFLGIIPVLNLVPLSSTVAERWLYFPIIGLIGVFLLGINTLKRCRFKLPQYLLLIFPVIAISFTIKTISRNLQWRDGFNLYASDLKINPESFDLQNNYGVELYRQGKTQESEKYFQKSIELNPYWWTAYNNLGVREEEKGNPEEAKILYQKSIDLGNYYLAYENLAKLYIKEKNYQQAEEFLKNTLKYFPTSPKLRFYYTLTLYQTNKYQQARQQAAILTRLSPSTQNIMLFNIILNKEQLPTDLF